MCGAVTVARYPPRPLRTFGSGTQRGFAPEGFMPTTASHAAKPQVQPCV